MRGHCIAARRRMPTRLMTNERHTWLLSDTVWFVFQLTCFPVDNLSVRELFQIYGLRCGVVEALPGAAKLTKEYIPLSTVNVSAPVW